MRELIARITALLRRVDLVRAQALKANGAEADDADPGAPLELGSPGHPLSVDRARRRVRADGSEVHLTPIEFDLLLSLARRPGQVVSRQRLLAEVWDWADASGTRTVDSHVKALRKKIGAERIRTVHGVGYALEYRARGGGLAVTGKRSERVPRLRELRELQPLDRLSSLRIKLGVLVAASVSIARRCSPRSGSRSASRRATWSRSRCSPR